MAPCTIECTFEYTKEIMKFIFKIMYTLIWKTICSLFFGDPQTTFRDPQVENHWPRRRNGEATTVDISENKRWDTGAHGGAEVAPLGGARWSPRAKHVCGVGGTTVYTRGGEVKSSREKTKNVVAAAAALGARNKRGYTRRRAIIYLHNTRAYYIYYIMYNMYVCTRYIIYRK